MIEESKYEEKRSQGIYCCLTCEQTSEDNDRALLPQHEVAVKFHKPGPECQGCWYGRTKRIRPTPSQTKLKIKMNGNPQLKEQVGCMRDEDVRHSHNRDGDDKTRRVLTKLDLELYVDEEKEWQVLPKSPLVKPLLFHFQEV